MQKANGEYAVTDHEFSEYFASIFVKDNNVIPPFEPNYDGKLDKFQCSVMDAIRTVRKLKSNSSLFLNKILARIAGPLCKVYPISLSESSVSVLDDWEVAFILPLHKKGNQQTNVLTIIAQQAWRISYARS